jgi:hypothetical protein
MKRNRYAREQATDERVPMSSSTLTPARSACGWRGPGYRAPAWSGMRGGLVVTTTARAWMPRGADGAGVYRQAVTYGQLAYRRPRWADRPTSRARSRAGLEWVRAPTDR